MWEDILFLNYMVQRQVGGVGPRWVTELTSGENTAKGVGPKAQILFLLQKKHIVDVKHIKKTLRTLWE